MYPRTGRTLRLAATALIQAMVAIARGGFVVHPPEPPQNLAPWLAPLYDPVCLSAALFIGVLAATYGVMALLQLIADGRFPRKAGPVEFDTESATLAHRGHESLELIEDLVSVVKDGLRRETEAQAQLNQMRRELEVARTPAAGQDALPTAPIRPIVPPRFVSDHERAK